MGIDTDNHKNGFAEVSVRRDHNGGSSTTNGSSKHHEELSLADYKKKVEEALREFYKEGDLEELYKYVLAEGVYFLILS